jgi:hypothetical protein
MNERAQIKANASFTPSTNFESGLTSSLRYPPTIKDVFYPEMGLLALSQFAKIIQKVHCHSCLFPNQAKLIINKPSDRYEQEAERIADLVMRMPAPLALYNSQVNGHIRRPGPEHKDETPRQSAEKEEEGQAKPIAQQITPFVQSRAELEEEEPIEADLREGQMQQTHEPYEEEEIGNRKSRSSKNPKIDHIIEARTNLSSVNGKPLSCSLRRFFEPKFGYDFSTVRVHDDANSAQLSNELNAEAFTIGQDIFFRRPINSGRDDKLIAHELTHVVQQSGFRNHIKVNNLRSQNPLGRHETGNPVSPILPLVIQRQIEEQRPTGEPEEQRPIGVPAITSFDRFVPLYMDPKKNETYGGLQRGTRIRILERREKRFKVRVKSIQFYDMVGYIDQKDVIIPKERKLAERRAVRLVFFQNPERIGQTIEEIEVGIAVRDAKIFRKDQQGRFIPTRTTIKKRKTFRLFGSDHPQDFYHIEAGDGNRSFVGYIRRMDVDTDIKLRRDHRNHFLNCAKSLANKGSSIYVDPRSQKCIANSLPIEFFTGGDIRNAIVGAKNCTNSVVKDIDIVGHGASFGIGGIGDLRHYFGVYLKNINKEKLSPQALTTEEFAQGMKKYLSNGVKISIYACHTGEKLEYGGRLHTGFAEELSMELRKHPPSLSRAKVRGREGRGNPCNIPPREWRIYPYSPF